MSDYGRENYFSPLDSMSQRCCLIRLRLWKRNHIVVSDLPVTLPKRMPDMKGFYRCRYKEWMYKKSITLKLRGG